MERRSEVSEQIELVRALKRAGLLYCAVPNGGRRGKREAILLKASGTVAGVPDLLIFDAVGPYIGAAVEMKRAKGLPSNVSKVQKKWLAELKERGWLCLVGYGAIDAVKKLTQAGYKITL